MSVSASSLLSPRRLIFVYLLVAMLGIVLMLAPRETPTTPVVPTVPPPPTSEAP